MCNKLSTPSLSVIILTFNEEQHIERCLKSIQDIARDIYIVDSFSTDKTREIAEALGAKIYLNKWPNNHSVQFNWALKNCDVKTKYIMRLDADEIISAELALEIKDELSQVNDIKGYILNRGHVFLGRKMMHGGNYPTKLLRIWEKGYGYCENKLMDEHIVLNDDYQIKNLKGSFWDHNLNSISWWIEKHNGYSIKEAIMQISYKYNPDAQMKNISSPQAKIKYYLKHNIYEKSPKALRSFLYFIYRYFVRLGFLDGYQGLVWNFLQGFWYRFLVDVKVFEIEKKAHDENKKIKEIIEKEYGYKI